MQNSERRSAALSSAALVACAAMATLVTSCDSGPYKPPALHQYTMAYDFTIQPDQAPPHARDDVHYSITILDRKTRQPIEGGPIQSLRQLNELQRLRAAKIPPAAVDDEP